MVNLLPNIRLAQSSLTRKFPSVDKPLQQKTPWGRGWPRGLFSEFYGMTFHKERLLKQENTRGGNAERRFTVTLF